jgi:hypothetical protein
MYIMVFLVQSVEDLKSLSIILDDMIMTYFTGLSSLGTPRFQL